MMTLTRQAEKLKIIITEEYFSEYMIRRVSDDRSCDNTAVTSQLTPDLDRGSSTIWGKVRNARALM